MRVLVLGASGATGTYEYNRLYELFEQRENALGEK